MPECSKARWRRETVSKVKILHALAGPRVSVLAKTRRGYDFCGLEVRAPSDFRDSLAGAANKFRTNLTQFWKPANVNLVTKRGESHENRRSVESRPTISALQIFNEGLAIGADFGPRYTILEKLGEGGMGTVYLAKDKELNREVALKLIRPALSDESLAVERFKREILLAGKITHKNILRIHDLGEVDGIRYVSMNYVRGQDLGRILRNEGSLLIDRVITILKQLSDGLKAAHDEGVIHRDLKPQNILLDDQDHVYISDFGLARSLEGDEETSLTGTGQVPGTPLYMSPEQIKGEDAGKQSDLYTLGIIVYEMLTAKFPFEKSGNFQALVHRLRDRPKNPQQLNSKVPDYLASIVMKCLEPDPADRYKDASEILHDLEAQKVRSVFKRSNRARVRRMGALIFAGILIVALGAGIIHKLWPKTPAPHIRSLAILPLENVSGNEGTRWMSRGLQDLLTRQLREYKNIRLVSNDHLSRLLNTSEIKNRQTYDTVALKNIAASCNANSVITGKILKGASGIRLVMDVYDFNKDSQSPSQFNMEGELEYIFFQTLSNLQRRLDFDKPEPGRWAISSLEGAQPYYESLDLLDRGDREKAIQGLTKLTNGTFQALAQEKLARIYYETEQLADVEKHLAVLGKLSETLPLYDGLRVQVLQAEIANKPDAILPIYKRLIAEYPNDSDLWAEIADHYSNQEDWDPALENYRRAWELDPKDIRILIALGRIQMKKGNPQTALTYLVEALSLQKTLNDKERADLLNILGVAYRQLEYYESALEHFQKSLAIKKKRGDQKGVALTLGNIGNVFRDLGRYDDANASYEEALFISEQAGDQVVSARMLNNLGNLAEKAGRLNDALTSYVRALGVARTIKQPVEIANRINNIGWIYYLQGRYADADTYFDLGLQQIGDNDPTTTASLQLSRGNLYLDQGEYAKALSVYEDATNHLKKTENKILHGFVLIDQARCFHSLGNFPEAKKRLDQAQELANESVSKELSAYLLLGRAESHRLQENPAEAVLAAQQAKLLAEQSKDQIALRSAKLELGSVNIAAGKIEDAIVLLAALEEEASSSGMLPLVLRARTDLAQAYFIQNKNTDALLHLQKALVLSKELGIPEIELRAHSMAAAIYQKENAVTKALTHIQQALNNLTRLQKQAGEHSNLFLSQKQTQIFLQQASALYDITGKQRDFSQYTKWIVAAARQK